MDAKGVAITAVAFVAGVLVGTYVCSGDGGVQQQSVRCVNECSWPDHCDPVRAHVMLSEIRGWAVTEQPTHIEPADQQRIISNVDRCMDPCLVGTRSSKHVCLLQGPTACEELPPIHQKANQAMLETDPGKSKQMWTSCADDLESFPGGR